VSYHSILDEQFGSAGLRPSTDVIQQLTTYCEELDRWNQRINLTGLRDEALVQRLIVEPAWFGTHLGMSGSLVDVGSGNGSPGIPLTLIRNLQSADLVEVRTRRVAFLRHIISVLNIHRIRIHKGKIEAIAKNLAPVDWISFQGLSPTPAVFDALRSCQKPSARLAWITTSTTPIPFSFSFDTLKVPFTMTEVRVVALDQS